MLCALAQAAQQDDPVDAALQSAYNRGILSVVAAGNDGLDACNTSPANSQYAITVGATTISDDRAFFSNYGSCVNIFGPGYQIESAWIGAQTDIYNTLSGTSQATPHVRSPCLRRWLPECGMRHALIWPCE